MPSSKASTDGSDARRVRELADILNETGLSEIEVDRAGLRIRVAKIVAGPTPLVGPPLVGAPSPVAGTAAASTPGPESTAGDTVRSPMVGTVYLQAQPGADTFVAVGETVAEGQTLLLIEAMKTMNPITAPRPGRIVQILVADAQPVEYGEPLVVIG